MNDNTGTAIVSISVCSTVAAVFYFVVVVWWFGLVEVWHAEEVLKHETCYTTYEYSEAHKVNNVKVSYCGKGEN